MKSMASSPLKNLSGVTRLARKKRHSIQGSKKALYWMSLPAISIYAFLFLFPALSNFQYALTRWDGIDEPEFVGLENFGRLATNDDLAVKVLGNNIEFMFWVVLFQTGFALLFATYLVKNTRASLLFRTIFFFPTILSSVSVAMIWLFLYDPNYGAINSTLKRIGLDSFALNWLGSENSALYAIIFVQVWFHTGQMMVIYIAGLQQIPAELYEAANVDGANRWQQFKSVTWPMALPTSAVVVAYTTIQSFRAFDLVFATTGGGPNNSTSILATMIFQTAFNEFRFGYAAAQSVIMVIMIFLITGLQRRILRTRY
jgi:raffinose/stachyose/melibiose transport system permease protein